MKGGTTRRFVVSLLLAAGAGPFFAGAAAARSGDRPPRPRPKPRLKPPAVIVLDPGHGGRDPGAIGRRGTQEKDITLEVCRAVRSALAVDRAVKVVLTRSDDRFLALRERVEMAQAARADLFVSIHADAAPNPAARGLSAYTLSEKASDDFAGQLAERENKVDSIYGVDLRRTDRETAAILLDLARRHSHNASLTARKRIIDAAASGWRLLDNPMRSANFAVLKSAEVPSVLVETGFLSNPEDERVLRDPRARGRIARLLAAELAAVALDLKSA